MDGKVTEKTLYDIKGVEIFSVGTWNGDNYTQDDLDEIVNAHSEIGHKLKPFLKIGHDNEQKLLQKDGYFSAGWISKVYSNAGKLFADFSDLPEKIYKLIKLKAYKRVSAEIFWNLKDENKTFKRALKAVALLGADTPAVTSLNDILELYTESDYEKLKIYTNKEVDNMDADIKAYKSQIDELESEVKTYKNQLEDLTKERDTLKVYIENVSKEAKEKEINVYLDQAIKDKKIVPAQRESFFSLSMNDFDSVKSIIDTAQAVKEFTETSESIEIEDKKQKKESMFANEDLDSKIKKYAKENKVSYSEAWEVVTSEEVE